MAKFLIVVHKSKYGHNFSCPTFEGCHSQGETEEEAVEKRPRAIRSYLAALKAEASTEAQEDRSNRLMLLTDVSSERAVRALKKVEFSVIRTGKHVVLSVNPPFPTSSAAA